MFAVIYPNQSDHRVSVMSTILDAYQKGVNFKTQSVKGNNFQTLPEWPDFKTLGTIPLQMQCEEIDFTDGKITSRRVLVVDVEVVVPPPEKFEKVAVDAAT